MRPRKAILIGLDAATLDLLDKYVKKGVMPHMKRLMEEGVTTESFCAIPPATSVNWNTIATGAYPWTHGVVAMAMRVPGEAPDVYTSGFSSTHCKAETIWEAVERAGRFPVLLAYTASWPPKIKRGVQVEGYADPDSSIFAISPRSVCTTRPTQWHREHGATHAKGPYVGFKYEVKPVQAKGWKSAPAGKLPPLEFPVRITPSEGEQIVAHALVYSRGGSAYDRILIAPEKDGARAWVDIGVKEWSEWIRLRFRTKKGEEEGIFRYRLFHLSPDGKDLRLYQSQVTAAEGWTHPKELCREVIDAAGPFQSISAMAVAATYLGVEHKEELFTEEFGYIGSWMGKAARHLLGEYEWDLFGTQYHAIDLAGHTFFGGLTDQNHPHRNCAERVMERMYRLSDEYVGTVLDMADGDTLVVVTSDHGFIETREPIPNVRRLLEEKGYLVYKDEEVDELDYETGQMKRVKLRKVDWSKSVAYDSLEYIWVNLKGRERTGIVDPKDYDRLCGEIIEMLQEVRSPKEPDKHYVMLAMKREDAEYFGLAGQGVGDVIYFSRATMRGAHHGNFPSARGKVGSMRAVSVFAGPGVKKGARLKRPVHLVDIAPTIAEFMGVPQPAQAEGRVLKEILE